MKPDVAPFSDLAPFACYPNIKAFAFTNRTARRVVEISQEGVPSVSMRKNEREMATTSGGLLGSGSACFAYCPKFEPRHGQELPRIWIYIITLLAWRVVLD